MTLSVCRLFCALIVCFLGSSVAHAAWIVQESHLPATNFRAVQAVSARVVWIGGSGGACLRTVNGGQTWKLRTVPGAEALERTVDQFRQSFDARRGGFGDAPKFPRPSELLFLLREHARTGDESARTMALTTLHAMALGGMRDHVGGGFHRYSVDGAWRVPHFEKMLYDQAQLVLAYAEGAQASGDPFYGEVAEDTLRKIMRDAEGGLFGRGCRQRPSGARRRFSGAQGGGRFLSVDRQ